MVPVESAVRTVVLPTVPISGASAFALPTAAIDTALAATMAQSKSFIRVLLRWVSTMPARTPSPQWFLSTSGPNQGPVPSLESISAFIPRTIL